MTQDKWYHTGLAFACQGCGNCCSGPDTGYVWANGKEIQTIAAFLKMSTDELKRRYLRRVGLRYSLIEKQPSKDCVFLTKNSIDGKTCQIYSARPKQCRTWPFWKENLSNSRAWDQASSVCPGIDQGQWFDYESIVAVRDGNILSSHPSLPIEQAAKHWIMENINNSDALEAITELYDTIDSYLSSAQPTCDNCGRCCDFGDFGHRLYTTTLEMLYFWHDAENSKAKYFPPKVKIIDQKCPHQNPQGCIKRDLRPAGCRIFYCRGLDSDFQSLLTENVLNRLKILHQQFKAVYYYANLLDWLKIK